jgi:hypothetical protein
MAPGPEIGGSARSHVGCQALGVAGPARAAGETLAGRAATGSSARRTRPVGLGGSARVGPETRPTANGRCGKLFDCAAQVSFVSVYHHELPAARVASVAECVAATGGRGTDRVGGDDEQVSTTAETVSAPERCARQAHGRRGRSEAGRRDIAEDPIGA